jgi:ferric-dicitrate binding protein FerR (iron transport regulator)
MENNIFNDENIAKYFAGELDEKILEKMEDQMINDNEKEKHIKDFSHLWEKSAGLGKYEKIDLESDWKKVKNRMGFKAKSKKIPIRSYFLRIAALLIFAFGLAYFFNQLVNNYSGTDKNDYFTIASNDQLKEFILPDNSVVTLNKNTSVIYNSNFGVGNRDIIIEGEAFFKVTKNVDLPFRIFAENSTIEVIGTQFNVNQKDEFVKVSVVNGHVAFYETEKKQNRIDLKKNEVSVYHKKKRTFDEKTQMNLNSLAWKTKKFEFQGESMIEALYYVSDYYNLELTNSFTTQKDRPMGSIPAYNTVDSVMNSIILSIKGNFHYKIENNKLVVSD